MQKLERSLEMEIVEDIVIVGAGIAGLTTCLGLHRLGLRSLVLESWDCLRVTGFAFTTWTNAWKALDALGIGDSLRQQHYRIQGHVAFSSVSRLPVSQVSYDAHGKNGGGGHEVRCVQRKVLLEALAKELPPGTIRFSSKVVSIEQQGYLILVHLEDGSVIKTKVLIGCDGVNSVVAQWLGLQTPTFTNRWSTRGYLELQDGHGFEPKFLQFIGDGFRSGFLPRNQNAIYWFFTWTSSDQYKEENPTKMKQFVLSKLGKVPKDVKDVVEKTELESIISSPLRFRWPFNVLWGNIYKDNVCVAGDALHPMTPDIGQGGCLALEDGIVLARCLAEAWSKKPKVEIKMKIEAEEYKKIKNALEKFSNERKWRSFELISTAYVVGFIQQSNQKIIAFLRDKLLSPFMGKLTLKKAEFDCGKLRIS